MCFGPAVPLIKKYTPSNFFSIKSYFYFKTNDMTKLYSIETVNYEYIKVQAVVECT